MSGYLRARSEGLITEEADDELLIYDETTQTAHALSKDATGVWRQCDGRRSTGDIAHRLGLEHARVAQALEELSAARLIEEPQGISRRALYKRTAKLGAAALSAPLIYSVSIPAASAAQSSACGSCLHAQCNLRWNNNTTCSGPPSGSDGCTTCSGSSLCTCQNLGGCESFGSVSFRVGACA